MWYKSLDSRILPDHRNVKSSAVRTHSRYTQPRGFQNKSLLVLCTIGARQNKSPEKSLLLVYWRITIMTYQVHAATYCTGACIVLIIERGRKRETKTKSFLKCWACLAQRQCQNVGEGYSNKNINRRIIGALVRTAGLMHRQHSL